MPKAVALALSHAVVAAVGFAAGIYVLPILIAPESPATAELQSLEARARFTGRFRRDLRGSDFLHWLREAWGPDKSGDSRTLRICIKNLRDKLEANPRRPAFI